MSQFDQLLDFGDSSTSETNGTTQNTEAVDEFDPFGPSPTIESKGAVDGNLLVDFTADTEISNGTQQNGTSEPFELSFEVSTSNDDAPNEPSTDAEIDTSKDMSSNPLYDLDREESTNPLYEADNSSPLLDFETTTTTATVVKSSSQNFEEEPSNPLYELSNNGDLHVETTVTTSESASSNPLYDFLGGEEQNTENVIVTTEKISSNDDDFLIEQTVTTTEQHYENTEEFDVNNSADQEEEAEENSQREIIPDEIESNELIQVETPREVIDEFESREIIPDELPEQEDIVVEDQGYEDMSRPSDQVDAVLDTYENTQIGADVIVPEETVPAQTVPEPEPEPEAEPEPEPEPEPAQEGGLQDSHVVSKETKRYSDSFGDPSETRVVREVTVQSMSGGQQNGYDAEPQHDPNVARETQNKEDFHFSEMSSVRNTFESTPQQTTVSSSQEVTWDEDEEGVYENEPVKRSDVVRESDRDIGAELPEIGMAKNIRSKFDQIGSETKSYKREITPPKQASGPSEFVSEPTAHVERYEGKAEAGIFESQPYENPDVVKSGESSNDPLPERGTAKNIASRFKQMESGTANMPPPSPVRREITPDRVTGKVEFVSEPRGHVESYEGKAEAGIFENQPQNYEGVVRSGDEIVEELPERGTAKNIAARFKQLEKDPSSSTPKGKRELTPDKNTRGEYVSEPRAHIDIFEGKSEAGVFENRPAERSDVVRADEPPSEEPLPERGYTRNIASKFREMESNMKSPPPTPNRVKEFTPPREGVSSGVFESQPQSSPDVVSENVAVEEIVPEKGYAKNLVSRFKQLEQENSKVAVSNRGGREFTPPRAETGVFENNPEQFVPDYNRKIDSGIAENTPEQRSDVYRETDPAKYEEELPERGTAKNLVSKWKQMETKSGNQSPSRDKVKEFTPPREEERVKQARTPTSPNASVHPNDLPGQYQQNSEPSVFESEPQHDPNVYREADTDWTEGMPKQNAAKKMVAKFKTIQAEANKEPEKPVSRKEEGERQSPESDSQVCESSSSDHDSVTAYDNGVPDDVKENVLVDHQEAATPKKKGGFFIPTTPGERCGACQKIVYAMEKLEMNKAVYHKNCFRCSHCKSKLTPKTFAVNNGTIYCTNHMMQLFKSKGNYDEGFGREQHKKRWQGDKAVNGEQEQV